MNVAPFSQQPRAERKPIVLRSTRRAPVDLGVHPRNHGAMDFEDASPRARAGDLIAQLAREDLDPLSVAELDERVVALQAEIERTQAKRNRAVNHKASADALFKK